MRILSASIKSHGPLILLLIVSTVALYWHSLGHEFLTNWDDEIYVTNNEAVRGITLDHLRLAFSRFYSGNYAPMQILSYMVDYAVWGMRSSGFILTNIVIHATNGVFYYALIIRLAGRRLLAFVAAFVFLLHPVQVESVVWISQRKNLLAMLFFLIASHFYLSYRRQGEKWAYLGSLAAFVVALLAKSVVVILPLLLLLHNICLVPRAERGRWWLVDKIPYIVAAGIVAVVALWSQSPESHGGIVAWHGGGPLNTFLTMLPVFFRYILLIVWPSGLSAIYNPAIHTGFDAAVIIAMTSILVMTVGSFWLFRRHRPVFFCFAVYLVALLPVSQIVPIITLMNDRYLYFPLLGAAPLVGAVAVSVIDSVQLSRQRVAIVFLVMTLMPLPILSWSRSAVWQDSLTLWGDAVKKNPGSATAWAALADAKRKKGDLGGSLQAYKRAIELDSLQGKALHGIGFVYLQMGNPLAARPYLIKFIKNSPTVASGFEHLGHSYYLTGEYKDAETAYRQAVAINPRSAGALVNLGNMALAGRRMDIARSFFEQALLNGGSVSDIEYSLACLYSLQGESDKAVLHLESALEAGFANLELVNSNPELADLRRTPAFMRLMASYRSTNRIDRLPLPR